MSFQSKNIKQLQSKIQGEYYIEHLFFLSYTIQNFIKTARYISVIEKNLCVYIASSDIRLINWLPTRFYVPLENLSLMWRRHFADIYAYARHLGPLSREGSLLCHTHDVKRGLGFSGLIRGIALFSPSYDTQGDAEYLF
jgi:hypothetical protein